jgi:hypothetical protein
LAEDELAAIKVVSERLELSTPGLEEQPSHIRPVVEHFVHVGIPLSHLILQRLSNWFLSRGGSWVRAGSMSHALGQ